MSITVSAIKYHKQNAQLEVSFNDNTTASFSAEFLRVHSPSAEVSGHHPSQAVLVTNKQDVTISNIQPVGNYAIKLTFSDGHDTGLYSWQYLHQSAQNQQQLWQDYLAKLKQANSHRDPLISIKQL